MDGAWAAYGNFAPWRPVTARGVLDEAQSIESIFTLRLYAAA
jgi:hypothetical protein